MKGEVMDWIKGAADFARINDENTEMSDIIKLDELTETDIARLAADKHFYHDFFGLALSDDEVEKIFNEYRVGGTKAWAKSVLALRYRIN